MPTVPRKRYPGSQPFETSQEPIFFGRDQDALDLFRIISVNDLTVVHGKSGYGKTSLLNAGVIPLFLREGLEIISLRFYHYDGETRVHPLHTVLAQLKPYAQRTAPDGGEKTDAVFLPEVQPDAAAQSLWQQFKSIQWLKRGKINGLVVIFDQFEELFTYPEAVQEEFALQFGELLSNRMPADFRTRFYKQMKALREAPEGGEALAFIKKSAPLHIVLGIRSDRVSMLDRLKPYYEHILRTMFELRPLSEQQTREAIETPAALPFFETADDAREPFGTPVFAYAPEALQAILDFLTKNGKKAVESTQIQVICQHIEDKLVQQQGCERIELGAPDEPGKLGNIKDIFKNYYDEVLDDVPEAERQKVRRLVENGLILESEQRRLSLFEGQIRDTYKIGPTTLALLVDKHHLLRTDKHLEGGTIYELSHDSLVEPVLEAKKAREEAEAKAEEERLEAEEAERQQRLLEAEAERQRLLAEAEAERKILLAKAEAAHQLRLADVKAQHEREAAERVQRETEERARRQAAEDEAEKTRLRRQRRTLWRFALIASALALVALTGAALAVYQTHQARDARREAEQQRELAVLNYQKANQSRDTVFRINTALILAQKALKSSSYQRRYEQGKIYIDQKRYTEALPMLEEALSIDAEERNKTELMDLIALCGKMATQERRFQELMHRAGLLRDKENFLEAYPLYREARALNFDNAAVESPLNYCRKVLEQTLGEDVRSAEIFYKKGNRPQLAAELLKSSIDPIILSLQLPARDPLVRKRDQIAQEIQYRPN